MTIPTSARRLCLSAAVAVALGGGGALVVTPAAGADIPRGMPMVVDRVLTPGDAAFWNPGDDGVRVATRLAPNTQVICSTGYQPPISCSLLPAALDEAQRPLSSFDVPRFGAAPLRIWFDTPRWGDGDTRQITERLQAGALS